MILLIAIVILGAIYEGNQVFLGRASGKTQKIRTHIQLNSHCLIRAHGGKGSENHNFCRTFTYGWSLKIESDSKLLRNY